MPEASGAAERRRFDVVIVGARCAGASLARHLASAGVSVALLDAAKLPSDQRTSTHLIHPPGMDELDALGVGDSVRELSPALRALRLSYDGREALLPNRGGRAAHCLRRETLDGLLQEAAVDAGAVICPRSRVLDVVREGNGRVSGVLTQVSGGVTKRLDAGLVVGADGRNSTIAKAVCAEEYLGYEAPRACYWAYWRRPPDWDPHEFHNTFEGTNARVIFPTDRDQLLIATVPPIESALGWRGDHAAAYLADIRSYRPISPQLGGDRPVGEVRGVLRTRYFFRAAAGPGWALIGDAGHHKEFVIGLGISDALRDARSLASAIFEGGSAAIERWWRRRDVERIEMFHWGREIGNAQPVDPLQRLLIARLASTPDLHGRFAEIIDGRRRPYDLIPSIDAARWVAAAALRGDTGAPASLLQTGRRRARARRDLRRCQRLARRSNAQRSQPPRA